MLTGIAVLSVSVTVLCKAFAPAYQAIQSTRENLRASQIVMQKAEALRLFPGSQVGDTSSSRQPLFVEPGNPPGVTQRAASAPHAGYISAGVPAADDLATASRSHVCPVTVTVCWTNFQGGKPIVQRRQIQAQVARNGMPKYIWRVL